MRLVRQGDSIPGLRGTAQDIRLYDPVNDRGEGDIAFWVRMLDPAAVAPAEPETEAVVRARPAACDRAAVPLPLNALDVAGYGWTTRAHVSATDGIVVEDVSLGFALHGA